MLKEINDTQFRAFPDIDPRRGGTAASPTAALLGGTRQTKQSTLFGSKTVRICQDSSKMRKYMKTHRF